MNFSLRRAHPHNVICLPCPNFSHDHSLSVSCVPAAHRRGSASHHDHLSSRRAPAPVSLRAAHLFSAKRPLVSISTGYNTIRAHRRLSLPATSGLKWMWTRSPATTSSSSTKREVDAVGGLLALTRLNLSLGTGIAREQRVSATILRRTPSKVRSHRSPSPSQQHRGPSSTVNNSKENSHRIGDGVRVEQAAAAALDLRGSTPTTPPTSASATRKPLARRACDDNGNGRRSSSCAPVRVGVDHHQDVKAASACHAAPSRRRISAATMRTAHHAQDISNPLTLSPFSRKRLRDAPGASSPAAAEKTDDGRTKRARRSIDSRRVPGVLSPRAAAPASVVAGAIPPLVHSPTTDAADAVTAAAGHARARARAEAFLKCLAPHELFAAAHAAAAAASRPAPHPISFDYDVSPCESDKAAVSTPSEFDKVRAPPGGGLFVTLPSASASVSVSPATTPRSSSSSTSSTPRALPQSTMVAAPCAPTAGRGPPFDGSANVKSATKPPRAHRLTPEEVSRLAKAPPLPPPPPPPPLMEDSPPRTTIAAPARESASHSVPPFDRSAAELLTPPAHQHHTDFAAHSTMSNQIRVVRPSHPPRPAQHVSNVSTRPVPLSSFYGLAFPIPVAMAVDSTFLSKQLRAIRASSISPAPSLVSSTGGSDIVLSNRDSPSLESLVRSPSEGATFRARERSEGAARTSNDGMEHAAKGAALHRTPPSSKRLANFVFATNPPRSVSRSPPRENAAATSPPRGGSPSYRRAVAAAEASQRASPPRSHMTVDPFMAPRAFLASNLLAKAEPVVAGSSPSFLPVAPQSECSPLTSSTQGRQDPCAVFSSRDLPDTPMTSSPPPAAAAAGGPRRRCSSRRRDNAAIAPRATSPGTDEEGRNTQSDSTHESTSAVSSSSSTPLYQCPACQKVLTTRGNLKVHMGIHQSYRPYACDMCPRRFLRKQNWKTHRQTHLNIRKLACHVCDWKFARKANLKRHLQMKHKVAVDQMPEYAK